MKLCEFCDQFRANGECALGLDLPKRLKCRMFEPSLEKFCADPTDFVNAGQLLQMAEYFDITGSEFVKIKQMARRAEQSR